MAELTRRYPGQVGAFIGFEEGLARRMFAGADFLLMPSRFEPCGLSQMYAQRFGCLPIAHATGGLIDTVDDGVTGFLFQHASVEALRRCLERAFRTFRLPGLLAAMRRAAMLRPSGWDVAGNKYLSLRTHRCNRACACDGVMSERQGVQEQDREADGVTTEGISEMSQTPASAGRWIAGRRLCGPWAAPARRWAPPSACAGAGGRGDGVDRLARQVAGTHAG